MSTALHIAGLSFGFEQRPMFTDLQLQCEEGRLVAICGLNGVGKSTLFQIIAGLQPYTHGSITFGHHELSAMRIDQRARQLAIVTTERPRLQGIEVTTVLEMAAHRHVSPDRMSEHIAHCQTRTGIVHLANRNLAQLSDGEMQKVMMARALAQNTPIIIADEPTAFLDYQAKTEMMQLMRQLVDEENKLVVFSTHDLEAANVFADKRYLLANRTLKEIPNGQLI